MQGEVTEACVGKQAGRQTRLQGTAGRQSCLPPSSSGQGVTPGCQSLDSVFAFLVTSGATPGLRQLRLLCSHWTFS